MNLSVALLARGEGGAPGSPALGPRGTVQGPASHSPDGDRAEVWLRHDLKMPAVGGGHHPKPAGARPERLIARGRPLQGLRG